VVSVGGRAGTDFPYLLWQMMVGKPVSEQTGRTGVRVVYMASDVPAAIHESFASNSLGAYLPLFAAGHSSLRCAPQTISARTAGSAPIAYKQLHKWYERLRPQVIDRPAISNKNLQYARNQ